MVEDVTASVKGRHTDYVLCEDTGCTRPWDSWGGGVLRGIEKSELGSYGGSEESNCGTLFGRCSQSWCYDEGTGDSDVMTYKGLEIDHLRWWCV